MKKTINEGALNYYNDIFLKSLHDISDKKTQEKAWLRGDYEKFNTFSEKYEQFVSSCRDILQWESISERQRQDLQKLYDMVYNYEDYYPDRNKTDKEICNDPKWHEIREYAKEVYKEFKDLFREGRAQ